MNFWKTLFNSVHIPTSKAWEWTSFNTLQGLQWHLALLGINFGYWILLLQNGMLYGDKAVWRPEIYWGYRQGLASHVAAGKQSLCDIGILEWSYLRFLGHFVSVKFSPWSWSAVRANPEHLGQRSHTAAHGLKLSPEMFVVSSAQSYFETDTNV